uniref:Protein FAM210A n=1 Tax=Cacopsylla melanoneura TaxID=428564 RepID=A0A8D8W288_9HEMI
MSLKELSQVVPVIRILSKNNLVFHQFRYTSTLIRNHGMYNIRATSPDPESPEPKKLSLYQRIKIMYRDYWYILAPVHLVTSAFWFGSFYYLAKSGVDIVAVMKMLGFSETLTSKLEQGHSTSAYLALAYALYKIATPLRYTVTLGGTTYSINKLKELGYIKPIPPKEKLVEMYEEKKEQLKEKSDQIKERIQDNKVMIQERYQDNKALLQEKISTEKCKMSLKRDKFLTTWRSKPKARQNGNGNTRQNGSKKVNGSQNGTKKNNGSSKGNGSYSKER